MRLSQNSSVQRPWIVLHILGAGGTRRTEAGILCPQTHAPQPGFGRGPLQPASQQKRPRRAAPGATSWPRGAAAGQEAVLADGSPALHTGHALALVTILTSTQTLSLNCQAELDPGILLPQPSSVGATGVPGTPGLWGCSLFPSELRVSNEPSRNHLRPDEGFAGSELPAKPAVTRRCRVL